jgi:hypothetical protein
MTRAGPADRWALTLDVNGASPYSIHAIENARRQILAAPTLVRHMPGPLRQLVGDLSDAAQVRLALGLGPLEMSDEHTAPDG